MYHLATKRISKNESKKTWTWVFSNAYDHACIGL